MFQRKVDEGFRRLQRLLILPEIIAVEGDVQLAILQLMTGHDILQTLYDAIGQVHAARLHPDQTSVPEISVVLNELVAQPLDCELKMMAVEDDAWLHGRV